MGPRGFHSGSNLLLLLLLVGVAAAAATISRPRPMAFGGQIIEWNSLERNWIVLNRIQLNSQDKTRQVRTRQDNKRQNFLTASVDRLTSSLDVWLPIRSNNNNIGHGNLMLQVYPQIVCAASLSDLFVLSLILTFGGDSTLRLMEYLLVCWPAIVFYCYCCSTSLILCWLRRENKRLAWKSSKAKVWAKSILEEMELSWAN